jgi:hypothetical protein
MAGVEFGWLLQVGQERPAGQVRGSLGQEHMIGTVQAFQIWQKRECKAGFGMPSTGVGSFRAATGFSMVDVCEGTTVWIYGPPRPGHARTGSADVRGQP